MPIRLATHSDRDVIFQVHLDAFPRGEGEIVAKLAIDLLFEESTPPTFSLVAEAEGVVVGHVAFSPVEVTSDADVSGYILAPLAVKPDRQKRGIGSQLVEAGMQKLGEMGVNILFVYGDPKYYGRFGFSADAGDRFIPPYELQYPFGWQAVTLKEFNCARSNLKITCVPALSAPDLW